MLQAMIDIGSNTVRLAIYQLTADTEKMVLKKKHQLGLAGYVKNGVMQEEGISRVCEVLEEFKAFLHSFRLTEVVAFTTAALRNARNSAAAVAAITARTGIPIRVISGDEEAVFDFIGATHGQPVANGMLVDIGGGSTELVSFREGQIERKISLPFGSLSLASAHVAGILPTAAELDAMQGEVTELLATEAFFHGLQHPHLTGIGGTLKSTTALHAALYGTKKSEPLLLEHLPALLDRFSRPLTEADLSLLFQAAPDRLHTLFPGMLIATAVAARLGSRTLLYSDSGVREGYLYHEVLPRIRGC